MRAIQAVFFIALLTLFSAMGSGGSRVAHFAHLGGFLTGFLLFKFPGWREGLRHWRVARRFPFPSGARFQAATPDGADLSTEVDRILEKISAKGVGSLTRDEHEVMQRYARKKK